ncbi:hypothetical protein LINGRAHAP2_LOCUS7392, partial [Linum grandiflorum]
GSQRTCGLSDINLSNDSLKATDDRLSAKEADLMVLHVLSSLKSATMEDDGEEDADAVVVPQKPFSIHAG